MVVSYASRLEAFAVTDLCEFFDALNLRFRLVEGIENSDCVGGNLLSAASHSVKSSKLCYRRSQPLIDDLPLLSVFQVFVEFFQLEVYRLAGLAFVHRHSRAE